MVRDPRAVDVGSDEERFELRRRHRLGEQVALHARAAERDERLELGYLLHPFRYRPQVEVLGQREDGVYHARVAPVRAQGGDECPVDLQLVDGQPLEVGQRRVTGAEVVDGQLDAHCLELVHAVVDPVRVVQQHALGDLQREPSGVEGRLAERPPNRLAEAFVTELTGREVHVELDGTTVGRPPLGHVAEGLVQYPRSDRHDQSRRLGHGNEVRRRHEPTLFGRPADQCFHAHEGARLHLHDRLVVQHELVILDGPAQIALEFEPVVHHRLHVRSEDLVAVFAGCLRRVHRHARASQQALGIVAPEPGGDADARVIRGVQFFDDTVRDAHGFGLAVGVLQQDGELVASEAGHRVRVAHGAFQAVAHVDERGVARLPSVDDVDRAEVVEVEEEDGHRAAVPAGRHQGVLQAVEEEGAIGEARQRVVERVVPELLLQALALGDVAGVEHEAAHAGFVEQVRHRRLEDTPDTVGVPDPPFEHHGPSALVGRFGYRRGPLTPVVGVHEQAEVGTEHAVDGEPERPLDRLALVQDDAVGVHDAHEVRRSPGQGGEPRVLVPELLGAGPHVGFEPPRQREVLQQGQELPAEQQREQHEAVDGEEPVEAVPCRRHQCRRHGEDSRDVREQHTGLRGSGAPVVGGAVDRAPGRHGSQGDEEEACEPTHVEDVACAVGAGLCEVGERPVGDGDGHEPECDEPERTTGRSRAHGGTDDHGHRDEHRVADRVGEGERLCEHGASARLEERLQHDDPAHGEHRAGDDVRVEDGAHPGPAPQAHRRKGEQAEDGQGGQGEEPDVGDRGERCVDVEHELVEGPHGLSRGPRQGGGRQQGPTAAGPSRRAVTGPGPARDAGYERGRELAEHVDGVGRRRPAGLEGDDHGEERRRDRHGRRGSGQRPLRWATFAPSATGIAAP